MLFARALGSDARIVVMDDPMRGVDVGTKQEVYAMIRDEAARGRTFLWYTTEMDELANCDHVYVFREGAIVADLAARRDDRGEGHPRLVPGRRVRLSPQLLRALLPAASLALLLAAIFWLQPRTMSYFGLNLLLNLAVPIALATIAQMFLLCVNDLDLSIGAFVSLVACIAATWLHDTPVLGVLALAGAGRRLRRRWAR